MRFTPGPGVGGHCLPIDPSYLSWRVQRKLGHRFRFVELANDVNDHMPEYVVHRVMAGLNRHGRALMGSRVLLLGSTYKKNTSDPREAPAIRVAELLRSFGAELAVVDPHVIDLPPKLGPLVELTVDELQRADAVVLLTDHDDFDFALVRRHARYVLDTRNRLVGGNVELL
jgi:UDP-N-acetyl-D-glucosamine dehydrogenase